jgi:aminopeptidase-like protein
MPKPIVDMRLFAELMELNLGVAQPDNRRAMEAVGRRCPIDVVAVPSRSEHNGWVVPDEWHVRRATIARNGRALFDGTIHPLAVAGYSSSFSGRVTKQELDQHVSTNPAFPSAYVFHSAGNYRPWQKHWGFCVPDDTYRTWGDGDYDIDLQADFTPGSMVIGVCHKAGRSPDTVVFNAHTCHPCQANDDLSGVVAIVALFQWLAQRDTRYSYRAVFAPEHLGTVFYLAGMAAEDLRRLKLGCFVEMVGSDTPLVLQQSFTGDTIIDRVAEYALERVQPDLHVGPFRTVVGNDETVWEAPGIEVPMISVSRYPYPQYHTSDDSLAIISEKRMSETVEALAEMVEVFETDCTATRRFSGLVALSNPKYRLYVERPDPAIDKRLSEEELRLGALQDRLPRFFDGHHSAFEIARASAVSFGRIRRYLDAFAEKQLVELHDVPSLESYQQLKRLETMAHSTGPVLPDRKKTT